MYSANANTNNAGSVEKHGKQKIFFLGIDMLNSKMDPPQRTATLSGQCASKTSEGLRAYIADANANNAESVEKHGEKKIFFLETLLYNRNVPFS